MAINVTIDDVGYSDVERIDVGGKSLLLSASAATGGSDVDMGSFVGDGTGTGNVSLTTTKKRSNFIIYTNATFNEVRATAVDTQIPVIAMLFRKFSDSDDTYNGSVCTAANTTAQSQTYITKTNASKVAFGDSNITLGNVANAKNVFGSGITYHYIAW